MLQIHKETLSYQHFLSDRTKGGCGLVGTYVLERRPEELPTKIIRVELTNKYKVTRHGNDKLKVLIRSKPSREKRKRQRADGWRAPAPAVRRTGGGTRRRRRSTASGRP